MTRLYWLLVHFSTGKMCDYVLTVCLDSGTFVFIPINTFFKINTDIIISLINLK